MRQFFKWIGLLSVALLAFNGHAQSTSAFRFAGVEVPDRSRVQGDENKDESLYGKYTIISTRHIITYTKHETIFEACTDSIDGTQVNPPSTVQNSYLSDSFTI